ncbi:DTW domain-containing protein [Stutzerimonas urumqiensis]|uniref:tRNA-uridine aminocarboxypropyltransferase n=1 Tax=Stutzerimonas urumqiensis TaxID=638269 RepID=UPI003DA5189F
MARLECARCGRPVRLCLCALIPSLDNRTRVLLLQHPDEARHALNTGRFVALGLRKADLWVGETFPALAELIAEHRALLLFPGAAAISATDLAIDHQGDAKERLLIVPDGTWKKARKLLYLNPELEELPRIAVPDGPPGRYRLRKAPSAQALSTVEAVVRALNALEPPASFDELLAPFEALIASQIAEMGEATYQRNYSGRES